MDMQKRRIFLGVVLLLIAVQISLAGYQNLSSQNTAISVMVMGVGLLLLLLTVFVFLDKNWVKVPLIIILAILLIYFAWNLIETIRVLSTIGDYYIPNNESYNEWYTNLFKWQLFQMIEYLVLVVIALILTLKKSIIKNSEKVSQLAIPKNNNKLIIVISVILVALILIGFIFLYPNEEGDEISVGLNQTIIQTAKPIIENYCSFLEDYANEQERLADNGDIPVRRYCPTCSEIPSVFESRKIGNYYNITFKAPIIYHWRNTLSGGSAIFAFEFDTDGNLIDSEIPAYNVTCT